MCIGTSVHAWCWEYAWFFDLTKIGTVCVCVYWALQIHENINKNQQKKKKARQIFNTEQDFETLLALETLTDSRRWMANSGVWEEGKKLGKGKWGEERQREVLKCRRILGILGEERKYK